MAGTFLSFVVPVYNAEAYLPQCLDSLLTQDIPQAEYEIICVNDGSTDGSGDILAHYQQAYVNIRVISQKNRGVAAARNVGMEQAQGDYIWLVDADDLARENFLGKLRSLAEGTSCDRIVVDGYTFEDDLSPEEQERAKRGTLPCNVPWQDSVVWRSVLRREFLRANGLTFRYPELTHGEDGVFMYEVSIACPSTQEFPETGYFYRIHSGSAETAATPESHERKLRSYIRIVEILQGYYRSGHQDPETANKLMTFLWFSLYETAQLPRKRASAALAQLKALEVFPSRCLPECTMERAYLTSQEGFMGDILDLICRNLHTQWGYRALRLLLWGKRLLGR